MTQLRGDLALAAVVALGSVLSLQSEGAPVIAVVAQVAAALSLALRRTSPFVPTLVVLAATVGTVLLTPTGPGDVFYLAIWVIGVYACGAYLPRGQSWVALALWWVTLLVSVQGRPIWGDLVFMGILTFGAWLPGVMTRRAEHSRRRAEELAERRREEAETVVARERAEIARELHDVVAHAIGVMVVHAGAAQELLRRDPDRASRALDTVQSSGEQAVLELRRMLGVLRAEPDAPTPDPLPRLSQLDVLLAPARAAGHRVEVVAPPSGEDVPPAVELTAYRVVQEAVTNAMKHAPGSRVDVEVRRDGGDLTVRVLTRGGRPADGAGTGHGLLGLRERLHVFAGELESGPRGDAFVVAARIPVRETRAVPE